MVKYVEYYIIMAHSKKTLKNKSYMCLLINNVMFYLNTIMKRLVRMLRINTVLWLGVGLLVYMTLTWKIRSPTLKKEVALRPLIMWWTQGFPGQEYTERSCGPYQCIITNKREHKNIAQAYLFYASDMKFNDLPLPRNTSSILWALFHEESPRNVPILLHNEALNAFNYSATFSRYSNVPLTLQYLNEYNDLITKTFFVSTGEKNRMIKQKKIAPVLYLQSDCDTTMDRDAYVEELMKYIEVDSLGACLNNKDIPNEFYSDYLNSLNDNKFLHFVAKYKFTIAIENGVCYDYITEKLWRPLKVGSVPIYYGSPTVEDWLPYNKSAVLIENYRSPRELAEYLKTLNEDDKLYEEYLQHKLSSTVLNPNLRELFNTTNWSSDSFQSSSALECFVCERLYNLHVHEAIVDQRHYNCSKPLSLLTKKESRNHGWAQSWYNSKEEAKRFYQGVVQNNGIYTPDEEIFYRPADI